MEEVADDDAISAASREHVAMEGGGKLREGDTVEARYRGEKLREGATLERGWAQPVADGVVAFVAREERVDLHDFGLDRLDWIATGGVGAA